MTTSARPATADLDDLPVRAPRRIRPGVMVQRWTELAFISWPYEVAEVQRLLPTGLETDTFAGAAWVSLVPFRLSIRLPTMPAVPWASRFPEINVRTYVRGPDGRRGIWFLSLDASRLGAVVVARRTYRLPYMWASATCSGGGNRHRYTGSRRWPAGEASWDLAIDVGGPMDRVDDLHRFLTARWRLYSPGPLTLPARSIGFVETLVDHPPWPLHHARLAEGRASLLEAAGLPGPSDGPVTAFAPGVTVRFARRSPIR